jgi:opacity protein-like surface antigen
VALAVLAAGAVRGEDSDLTRYYFGFRYGEITPGLVKAHDVAGAEIGVNLGRYFGIELALDSYEVKVGEVAEMSVLGLVPQARLRYPFCDDRLVPYLVAGVGLAVTQGNDARAQVDWVGGKNDVLPMGSAGGGVDYFVADNLSVGLQGKYLASGDLDYSSGGVADSVNVSSAIVTLGFRVFYPELHPAEDAAEAADAPARFYLSLRTGGVLLVHLSPFPGISSTPEQSVFGSNFTQQFGVSVGANIGRYASVELALDNYEIKLALPDVGGIGEYAVFPIAVQGRVRIPVADQFESYVLAGAGAEYGQLNDRTPAGEELKLNGRDLVPMGVFGTGLEYALMSNVSIGGEAKYVIARGHSFQVEPNPAVQGNFDAFVLSLAVRVFFFSV